METPAGVWSRGTIVAGRYEILEELGAGGMGTVYRTYDRKPEEEVALKLIRPEIAANRKTIERFKNELKIARKIGHKNVCKMYDLGEAEGTSFITMEYVSGEDLRSFIRRSGQLTVGKTVLLGGQIAEGLAEAHRLGVVHRDLKPGNIMIDKDGQAKIMDFGIARSLLGKGLTGEGTIIGTPEYMSPEQVEGKEADQRSDIYALGVILFEMVVGSPPFEGETPFSIANKHKTEPPPIPKKLLPQIPDALSKIILRCLEKDKAKRYQSAEELVADLTAVEQTLPSADRPLTRARTKIRTSREITVKLTPRKMLIPVLAAVLLIATALVGRHFISKKEPAPAPKIENSIAVISLRNQSGDKNYDYLCQRAIPDLLITNLENSGFFYVATWERMVDLLAQMGKKGVQSISEVDGFQACRREGIKFIVLGSLTKAGDMFMTDVKILDADKKTLVKGIQSRGRGEGSILENQIDELSRNICSGMGLSEDKIQAAPLRIADVTTSSIEAYEQYLKGLDLYWDYKWPEARAAWEKAVQIDPSFASAYRWLAQVCVALQDQSAFSKAAEQAIMLSKRVSEKERLYIEACIAGFKGELKKARAATDELVQKYPKEKEAHNWRGRVLAATDLKGAIQEMSIVIELDPNFIDAYNEIALYYGEIGDLEKAVEFGKKYVSVSSGIANSHDTLASIYLAAGKHEEALANWKKAVNKDPNFYPSYWSLVYLSALKEDYPAAMNWLDRLFERKLGDGINADVFGLKAFLELWLGQFRQSLTDFDRAAVLAKAVGNVHLAWYTEYYKAMAYCEMGNYELSQKFLQAAYDSSEKAAGGQTALTKQELAYSLAWNDVMLGRLDAAKLRLEEIKAPLPEMMDSFSWRIPGDELFKKKIDYLYESLAGEIAVREGRPDLESLRRTFADNLDFSDPDLLTGGGQ